MLTSFVKIVLKTLLHSTCHEEGATISVLNVLHMLEKCQVLTEPTWSAFMALLRI
jgi:hypothetical protein